MRVFVGDWDCLLHDTARNIMAHLPHDQFVRIHRSVIVRADFVERLIHERNTWTARLRDGSRYRIAKSHVAATLEILSNESSKKKVDSSMTRPLNETQGNVVDFRQRVPLV